LRQHRAPEHVSQRGVWVISRETGKRDLGIHHMEFQTPEETPFRDSIKKLVRALREHWRGSQCEPYARRAYELEIS
jgi:hypothetical protein